jgi:hypothetical protein
MIGIIGGYGKAGLQAARVLKAWGNRPLRIGGRNPEKHRQTLINQFPEAEWIEVDIENDDSLKKFITGCELIINCVGPSHKTTARVMKICLSNNCHLVDAGEGKGIEEISLPFHGSAVLHSAGALPGLSGILPRWLAGSFDNVTDLTAYSGGLDQFTLSGAEDYLFGIFDKPKPPLSAWKDGACRPFALKRETCVALPFFRDEVTLHPYFDTETEFVARQLSLINGQWYMGTAGERMSAALEGISGQFYADTKGAIKRLCSASQLDAAGRQTYFNYLIQLEGIKQGNPLTRTLVLQATGACELTGAVAAVAGIALLSKELSFDICPVSAISNPGALIPRLSETEIISQLDVFDCSISELSQEIEGEI